MCESPKEVSSAHVKVNEILNMCLIFFYHNTNPTIKLML